MDAPHELVIKYVNCQWWKFLSVVRVFGSIYIYIFYYNPFCYHPFPPQSLVNKFWYKWAFSQQTFPIWSGSCVSHICFLKMFKSPPSSVETKTVVWCRHKWPTKSDSQAPLSYFMKYETLKKQRILFTNKLYRINFTKKSRFIESAAKDEKLTIDPSKEVTWYRFKFFFFFFFCFLFLYDQTQDGADFRLLLSSREMLFSPSTFFPLLFSFIF